jgi:predicted phosphodiesterase
MRVAILSDIHGNKQALEAVLADAATTRPDALWCLGDLVGYGADPDACVQLTRKHTSVCLVGNHDLAVRGDLPMHEFSRGAAVAATWTRETIGESELEWLGALEPADLGQVVGLFHASPRDPVWEYVLSSLQADLCLSAQRHRVCLVGHSHVALAFSRDDGEPTTGQTRHGGTELDVGRGEWLINPGSVGQPRDGDPRAAWLLLDTDRWTASWRRVEYDIDAAAAAIRAAKLPESLAERLHFGQ